MRASFLRTCLHVAQRPLNVAAVAATGLMAVAADNPLPAILYGLGFAAVNCVLWSRDQYGREFERQANEAERAARRAEADATAERNRQMEELFAGTDVPDMRRVSETYARLVSVRNDIERVASERERESLNAEKSVVDTADRILVAYAKLASKYFAALAMLTGSRLVVRRREYDVGNPILSLFVNRKRVVEQWSLEDGRIGEIEGGTFEERDANLAQRILELQREIAALPERSPAREVKEGRLKTLSNWRQLLADAGKNYEAIQAQLSALPEKLEYIHSRMLASGLLAEGAADPLDGVVEDVDQTLRFVESIRLAGVGEEGSADDAVRRAGVAVH